MGLGEQCTCVRVARLSEYETRRHASRARKAPILVAQLHRRGARRSLGEPEEGKIDE
ncbi:hypothetical protein WN51_04414 [Melipona quadrifasciata]|uniref:Uncharacterized protein n=1 Tax=Melipona quadrifasciata TaxID=166423 RepID=A0A0N0U3P4_9HYME|nr:hypothetical protein WN51_04414 [Melipona quadrifasciata]